MVNGLDGLLVEETLLGFRDLETQNDKILVDKKCDRRLKIHATWMVLGDNNTKCFHNSATHWKLLNITW